MQVDQPVLIEAHQHLRDLAAPDIEDVAQHQLVEFRARRQPLVDDRCDDVVVDVVQARHVGAVVRVAEADEPRGCAHLFEHDGDRLCAGLCAINAKH